MKHVFLRWSQGVAAILAGLLALSLFYFPAYAQDTEIYTVVPQMHDIVISIDKGGAVIDENGIVHTESYTAHIPHGGTLALIVRPDSYYMLESAKLDEQDLFVSGGRLEIKGVSHSSKLAIAWKQTSTAPLDKTYTIVGTVTENDKPVQGVTLELRSRLKTFITGEDGKFRFDDVESGAHSLSALKDGKIVGYMLFTLKKGNEGVNVQELPDGTFQLDIAANVATLKLDVVIQEDGTMTFTKAIPVTDGQVEGSKSLATGDDFMITHLMMTMFVTGTLVFLLAYRKREKIRE